jgi:hypothetical protein
VFEAQLKSGPFIYIARTNNSSAEHAIVITGIENRHSLWRLYYIDPWVGREAHEEFFKFVVDVYKPAAGTQVLAISVGPLGCLANPGAQPGF